MSSRLGTPDAAGRCLFSRLPPGFPVVPQYLGHTSVVPQPLTQPGKRLSHIRLFTQTFSFGLNGFMLTRILLPSHLSVFDLCSQGSHALNRACVSSCTDVRAREPSLHGDEPFHRYTGSRPTTRRPFEQLLSRCMFILGRKTQDPSRTPGLLHDCCWLDAV